MTLIDSSHASKDWDMTARELLTNRGGWHGRRLLSGGRRPIGDPALIVAGSHSMSAQNENISSGSGCRPVGAAVAVAGARFLS